MALLEVRGTKHGGASIVCNQGPKPMILRAQKLIHGEVRTADLRHFVRFRRESIATGINGLKEELQA